MSRAFKLTVRYASVLLAVFFVCVSCSYYSKKNSSNAESTLIDSFAIEFPALSQQNINEAKRHITVLQQQMTDSVNYYILFSYYAKCLYAENKIDSAIMISKRMLHFYNDKLEENRMMEPNVAALNDIGVFFQSVGKNDSAIVYFQKAAQYALMIENQEKRVDIYINIADYYRQNGKYPLSADYYRKAMMLSDSLNLQNKYDVVVNMGLAHIYTDLNNFDLADTYFQQIEGRLDSLAPNERLYFSNTRGNYYYLTKEYEKSLPWFYRTRTLAQKYGQEIYISIADINLGEVYLLLNQNDSAQYYLDKSFKVFGKSDASPAIVFYLNGLYASLYLQTNRIREAEQLLSEPYDTTAINALYIYQHDKRLEELYRKKGDYKKAYFHSQKAQKYDNESRKTTVQNNIEEINFRYSQDTKLLKKDILIRKQEQQVQQMSYTLILGAAIFIILTLTTVILLIYRRRRNERLYSAQIATITKLRMENIQNRMSPHFIFNALNSLMPNLREYHDLNKPMGYLVKALRNSLTAPDTIGIEIGEEIKHVKNYLDLLESLKYELPTIHWNVDENINLATMIPAMCIQIPVENVVKYAFEDKSEDDLLEIIIKQDEGFLWINIIDNGKGFDSAYMSHISESGTGSGLKILYKTIALLNTKNNKKATLEIMNNTDVPSHGTTVSMKIPKEFNFAL
ncbi:histidine kinase [Paludibacter sp.]